MIRATAADRPAVEAFLKTHMATSLFALSNLRRHGMAGGHPRAVSFWLRWQGGAITDALTVSDEGMIFPQCPTAPWGDACVVLTGLAVKGILGDAAQVAALRAALRLPEVAGLHEVEPRYELDLADLRMPDMTGYELRPLSDAPRDLVIDWRRAYLEEVLPMPGEDTAPTAERDIASYLEADSHRVLYQADQPVALTGFNAILPEAVQIGGVYTPPALRACGHARRAVALHLAEARAAGVPQAFLFAASAQACRAYEAIGFSRAGEFTILVHENPVVVHG
jgi:hypothetical protein